MRTEGVRLTRREEEVLELVFLGLADKEIPEHLPTRSGVPVSVSTVRNIITGIKAKLHVQHRTEMSLWWAIKRYNISVDWTPLRRRICAGAVGTKTYWRTIRYGTSSKHTISCHTTNPSTAAAPSSR